MRQILKVALVGNPNTGKTSLFNALTGLRQKVGNFPGITVDKSTGYFTLPDGRRAELTDLPGTYSLFPKSKDEAIPLEILLNKQHPQHPDLILYIADASNLKRNLVLLTQITDLKIPVILALNMIDQAAAKGIAIDIKNMQQLLDMPVVAVNARKKQGIDKLLEQIQEGGKISARNYLNKERVQHLPLHELVPAGCEEEEGAAYNALLQLQQSANHNTADAQVFRDFRSTHKFDTGQYQREDLLHRYRAVNTILEQTVKEDFNSGFRKTQQRIDAVLTHKVGGYLIFFSILFIVFQAIFHWAELPMALIEEGFAAASQWVADVLPAGILNDLITNGVLAGLSGVIVFIPQIAFLFFFISIMEDTGYLARVAFLMDRAMRRFGLNGKSVIPLISGTACAVPAIMSARNIEHTKARLITILVTPLMSCSARLPVYILLIGLAVPDRNVLGIFNMQGLALMAMYLLGFAAVIGAASIYQLVLKSNAKQYFILEMPVYRMPNWQNVGITVFKKVKTFVTEAGKIIVAISIILWFLAAYGPSGKMQQINQKYEALQNQSISGQQHIYEAEKRTEKLAASYAGILGKSIEPAIAPLGFDWKIGIALITSFAAREVFVGTMATLYSLESDSEGDFGKLQTNLRQAEDPQTGKKIYTFATIVSLLLFYAFAMQCISTIAITYKETGSLKWTAVQFFSMSGLAYVASFIAYQLLS